MTAMPQGDAYAFEAIARREGYAVLSVLRGERPVGLIKHYPDGAIFLDAVTRGDRHRLRRKEHDAVLEAYRRHVEKEG